MTHKDYPDLGKTHFDRMKRAFVQDCIYLILKGLQPAMKRRATPGCCCSFSTASLLLLLLLLL